MSDLETSRESEYLSLVSKLPLPSATQAKNFASYVSSAHSWYKHLPLYPSATFTFFLDPNAGRQRVHTSSGGVEFVHITNARDQFHYSTRNTNDYLENFGYWNYHVPYGTSFIVSSDEGWIDTNSNSGIAVRDSNGRIVQIPRRLEMAGRASVNALIHPHRNYRIYWAILPKRPNEETRFPNLYEHRIKTLPDSVRTILQTYPDLNIPERILKEKIDPILDEIRKGLLLGMEDAMAEFLRVAFDGDSKA